MTKITQTNRSICFLNSEKGRDVFVGRPAKMVRNGSMISISATKMTMSLYIAKRYGGEFRRDIESFVSIEAVTACVSRGIYERAPQRGVAAALTTDPGAAYLEFCRRFNGSTDGDPNGVEAWRRLRDFAYVSTGGAVRLW
jgi:hypothetical protein